VVRNHADRRGRVHDLGLTGGGLSSGAAYRIVVPTDGVYWTHHVPVDVGRVAIDER